MNTRRVAFSLLCMVFLLGGRALSGDVASGVLNETTLARAAIEDIEKLLHALKENQEAQERAWPTREVDQSNEVATPPAVEKLQVKQIKLQRKLERRCSELQKFCESDPDPILSALKRTRSHAFLDAVVPVAVKVCRDDPRLLQTLKQIESRLDDCPPSVVNGLADLNKEEASLGLLERGMKEKKLSILRAAGKSGDPVVLAQLITAAESEDKDLAKVCREAIMRLTPPPRPSGRLVGLLVQRIPEARSSELQASLIVYLGLCKAEESLVPLAKMYAESSSSHVRSAVVGALGNLGTEGAGRFVLGELRKKSLPVDVVKSCIHALGGARYRPAIPALIGLMDDAGLNRDTARALQRISGRDLGNSKAKWLRWWRQQPEARNYKDRDE